jgi:Leucine-rich repeat (LRR) protein
LLDNWWENYELTKIDLSNNKINYIPGEISTQEQIQHINLNSNQLDNISGEVFALVLKFFDASNNKIFKLPDMIGSCNSLVELHLAGNQLSELPESFGGLENLEVLDLK